MTAESRVRGAELLYALLGRRLEKPSRRVEAKGRFRVETLLSRHR